MVLEMRIDTPCALAPQIRIVGLIVNDAPGRTCLIDDEGGEAQFPP